MTLFFLELETACGQTIESTGGSPTLLPPVIVTGAAPSLIPDIQGESELSQEELNDLGVKAADDLDELRPNFVYRGGGERSFNGIEGERGMMNSLYFTDPAVVLYVDDVPYSAPFTNYIQPDATSSLTFIQGPEAAGYGMNGPAGIIDIQQDKPTNYWKGILSNEYGSYDYYKSFLEVSGPVTQKLSFLGSFNYESRDGYLINTSLGTHPDWEQEIGGRFALRWEPYSALTLDLNIEQRSDQDGSQRFTPLSGSRYDTPDLLDGRNDIQAGVQSLRTEYRTDDYTAVFISSHRSYDLNPNLNDFGLGGPPVPSELDFRQEQYVQEFRLQSGEESALHWKTGFLAEHIDLYPASSQVLPGGVLTTSNTSENENSGAIFGEVGYKPVQPLTVTFSDRFQVDIRSGNRTFLAPGGYTVQDARGSSYLNTAPKLSIVLECTKTISLSASSGLTFRPGGYAPFAGAATLQPYGDEQTWANQVGASAKFWDKRITLSGDLFWNETRDYQLERYNYPLIDVVNVPWVAARGVEGGIEIKPCNDLTLNAQFGYTEATFQDYHDGVTGQSLAGNAVPYVPQFTALVAATYRRPKGWLAHVDFRGLGDTDFDQANTPSLRQASYGLLGARIGYEARHWAVYLYGENLTNTQYDTMIDSGLGVQVPGAPQTIGMKVDLKW